MSNVAPIPLSRHPRLYAPHEVQPNSLLDIFARALIGLIEDIEANGLLRQYVQRVENTSFPKGRIMLNQTMARHAARGVNYRVGASWFEASVDNPPNRCLKYAVWSLALRYNSLKLDQPRKKLLAELNRIYRLFSGVSLDNAKQFLTEEFVANPERIPSIRAYYRDPIRLAVAIAQNKGVALTEDRGMILLATLLLSLQQIFENYIRAVLQARFLTMDHTIEVLDGNNSGPSGGRKPLFDDEPSEVATPDIVLRRSDREGGLNRNSVVIDAKYKKVTSRPDREDVNQVITYGCSYRTPSVVLVYPRVEGASGKLLSVGKIDDLSVYQYAFDLGAEDLDDEERAFAGSMFQLIQ